MYIGVVGKYTRVMQLHIQEIRTVSSITDKASILGSRVVYRLVGMWLYIVCCLERSVDGGPPVLLALQ
jgi:hypothetical protein